jgi:two-component system cell cycle sensor histidine kinase/response regulator CckA
MGEAKSWATIAVDVLDSLLEGCQVVDFDYRYRFLNEAALRQSRLTMKELLGRRMEECFPGIEQTPMFKRLRGCMVERTYQRMDNEFRFPDGSLGWFDLRFLPVPEGVCILSLDVTDAKRSAANLVLVQDQLRHAQKMEAIGRLAGGVAHDFNNILSVILTYGLLLRGALPKDSPFIDDVDEMTKAAERAARLTEQLLTFSRRQVTRPRVLDLSAVVLGLTPMTQKLLGEDVVVRTKSDPGPAPIKADPSQIEQVIINLVVNARDAMPNGGRLEVEIRRVDLGAGATAQDDEAELGLAPGAYVRLSVKDSGTGMDAATRERIFEPFFSTKGPQGGTGLGLSTVYGIVKQYGGAISVWSEIGQGTRFDVYLPEATEPLSKPSVPPAAAHLHGTETILLAEDDEQLRRVTQAMLEDHGYLVLAAKNGRVALETSARYAGKIDLLLTDVVMPGMNGRQLATELLVVRPDLHVIYMTGYTEDSVLHRGVQSSSVVLVQKPFTPDRLLSRIRQVLTGCSRAPTER